MELHSKDLYGAVRLLIPTPVYLAIYAYTAVAIYIYMAQLIHAGLVQLHRHRRHLDLALSPGCVAIIAL